MTTMWHTSKHAWQSWSNVTLTATNKEGIGSVAITLPNDPPMQWDWYQNGHSLPLTSTHIEIAREATHKRELLVSISTYQDDSQIYHHLGETSDALINPKIERASTWNILPQTNAEQGLPHLLGSTQEMWSMWDKQNCTQNGTICPWLGYQSKDWCVGTWQPVATASTLNSGQWDCNQFGTGVLAHGGWWPLPVPKQNGDNRPCGFNNPQCNTQNNNYQWDRWKPPTYTQIGKDPPGHTTGCEKLVSSQGSDPKRW
jgi:hypothetical protein